MEKFNEYKALLVPSVSEVLGYIGVTLDSYETLTIQEVTLRAFKHHEKNGSLSFIVEDFFGNEEMNFENEEANELKTAFENLVGRKIDQDFEGGVRTPKQYVEDFLYYI